VFDPLGILAHIEEYTRNELDLRNELKGQQTLAALRDAAGAGYDLRALRFPRIYPDLTNANVMVAEYVPGRTLDEMIADRRLPYTRLLELFHVHGYFLFGPGVFHGDIHPGNIILHDHAFYFIDTSAVSTITARTRAGLYRFFAALSRYEYDACAHALNAMAATSIEGRDFARFREKFLDLYRDFTNASVSQVSLTKRMMQTIKLGVHNGMMFESGMFAIIKSMMYLDGMVLAVNPDAVLMKDMRQFIDEFDRLQAG
jgi:ubiquinone biosynthesis protein